MPAKAALIQRQKVWNVENAARNFSSELIEHLEDSEDKTIFDFETWSSKVPLTATQKFSRLTIFLK